MEQRMNIVTLGVSDLKRSREFYERLGWRRSMAKSNDIVFFQMGGMALGLYPSDELAKDATVSEQGDGFRRFTLAYCARTREEVKTILEEAQKAGAETSQACAGCLLGRPLRLLCRSGWISVGGRMESVLSGGEGWEH